MERTAPAEARPRLITTPFLFVTAATFAYFCSLGMLLPVIPRYVEDDLGGGGLEVGLAVGAFAASAALFRPLVGRLGDRRGRRIIFVLGSLVVATSVAGYSLTSTLALLVLLRLVSGVGEAAVFVGAATSIQDMAPAERRGEAASYFSIALYGGLALGPPVGEFLYQQNGPHTVWYVAAGAAVLAALLGCRMPIGTLVPPNDEKRPFLHPDAVMPGVVLFLGLFALAGFTSFVPLYVDDIGLDGAGPVFILYATFVLALRLVGARIPDRLGSVPTATVALLAIMAGMAGMGLWPSPAGLYAGTAMFSVGMALLFPAMFSTVMHAAPEDERSHAVGTFSLFFDLAQGIGAIVLGAVVALSGERGAFVAASLVAALGVVVLRRSVPATPAA